MLDFLNDIFDRADGIALRYRPSRRLLDFISVSGGGIRSQGISLAQRLASRHLARAPLRYCCPRDVSTIGNHPTYTIYAHFVERHTNMTGE
jgi:hypothetical protein